MSLRTRLGRFVQAVAHRALSVPMLVKVLGIGVFSAFLAGGLTFLQARSALMPVLHDRLEERVRSTGLMLQDLLWPDVITGNLGALEDHIRYARRVVPDLRYILVQDAGGRFLAHSFDRAIPLDLAIRCPPSSAEGDVQILTSEEGDLYDAQFSLQEGSLGRIRIGLSDRSSHVALESLTHRVLRELGLAITLSLALALALGRVLADPLNHLVELAGRIGNGEFGARARVYASDQMGHLAEALNGMAGKLEAFRAKVEQTEAEHLRLVAQTVDAQEAERKAISLDLHDRVGQSLLTLLLALRAADEKSGLSSAECSKLSSQVETITHEVRQLAWDLRPPHLGERGLQSALSHSVEELQSRTNLRVDQAYLVPPELPRLPAEVEVALYRVAQEALSNVLRHSKTERASLVLLLQPGVVTLLIEDSGAGFDPESPRTNGLSGIGLIGMRERVRLVGGELMVDSEPGQGTAIRATVPLAEETTPCPSAS